MTAVVKGSTGERPSWPALPLDAWRDTLETVHRWMQLVGKTRLALAAPVNHWWHTTLYVTARGLTTSPMPYGSCELEVAFDFLRHELVLRTSRGEQTGFALEPMTVAAFYRRYLAALDQLGMPVRIWPVPVELEDALSLAEDEVHRSYDAAAVERCWRNLATAARVLTRFRSRFLGKASPVHFFWGGFDLACTRFSGRRAPEHPGGVPHLADRVVREAYSHECSSAGWWPGGGPLPEAAFYSYAYPEPPSYARAAVRPPAAYYHPVLGEFVLPQAAVLAAAQPETMVLDFLQSTYEAGADLGGWDRPALERPAAVWEET